MMDLISAALVTDTELIVSQSVVPQVIDWLYDHGHRFDCWEGLVRSSEGKYTLSSKYCMPKGNGTHGLLHKNDMKETINIAHIQFLIDNDARGQELYIIIKLKDKTDIA